MTESAADQLAALARVHELLTAARIDYWLFGGWAVDFHAGAVTRAHSDVDLAVWLADIPRIEELLSAVGWRAVPSPEDDGGTGYERGMVRLELTYLVRADDGGVYIPLRSRRAQWPADALEQEVAELRGVRARIVARQPLARMKASPREDPADAAKDVADYRWLTDSSR